MAESAAVATPFNGPLETGVRALTVLAESAPAALDLQRLVYFDYLVVHSADAGGPRSLHPNTPLRNGELLVRRAVIERGALLMVGRSLVERRMEARGITYAATDEAAPFLDCLTSAYARSLRQRAEWVIERFGHLDEDALKSFVDTNFERWTREFQSTAPLGDRLL